MSRRPIVLDVEFAANAYETLCYSRFTAHQFAAAIRSDDPQELRSLVEEAGITISQSMDVMYKAHGGGTPEPEIETPFTIIVAPQTA